MDVRIKGYGLGIAASVAYGTNPALAVPLYREGLDVMSVLLLRYALAFPAVLLLWWSFHRHDHVASSTSQIVGAICLGVLMVASSVTLFASYMYMDVGIASSLLFVYPLLVALIMSVAFGERIGWLKVVCLVCASAGVTMLCKNSGTSVVTATGLWLVVASALSYALYLVGVKLHPINKMGSLELTVWVIGAGVVVLALSKALTGTLILPRSITGWLCAFGLALIPTILSLLCTNAAIDRIGSTATASLGAFEPVTAVAIGILMLGERMTATQVVGLVIVLVSVTTVLLRGQHGTVPRCRQ